MCAMLTTVIFKVKKYFKQEEKRKGRKTMTVELKDNVAKVVNIEQGLFSTYAHIQFLEDTVWTNKDSMFEFEFDKGEVIALRTKKKNILQWAIGSKVSFFHIFKYSTNWAGFSNVKNLLFT